MHTHKHTLIGLHKVFTYIYNGTFTHTHIHINTLTNIHAHTLTHDVHIRVHTYTYTHILSYLYCGQLLYTFKMLFCVDIVGIFINTNQILYFIVTWSLYIIHYIEPS